MARLVYSKGTLLLIRDELFEIDRPRDLREYSIRRVKAHPPDTSIPTQTGQETKQRTRGQPEKGNMSKDGSEKKDWRNNITNVASNPPNPGKQSKSTKPNEVQSVHVQKSRSKGQQNISESDGLWDLPGSSSITLMGVSQREQFELERQALRSRPSRAASSTSHGTISEETDWILLDLANKEIVVSQSELVLSEPNLEKVSFLPNANLPHNQSQSNSTWFTETLGQNFDDPKSDELELFGSFFVPGAQTATELVTYPVRNAKTSRLGSLLGISDSSSDKYIADVTPEEVLDLDAVAILGDLLDETSDNRMDHSTQKQEFEVPQKGLVRIPMGTLFGKNSMEKTTPQSGIHPLIIPESEVMKSLIISPTFESHSNEITLIPQEKLANTDLLSRLVLASHHPVSQDRIQHSGFSFHSTESTSSESSKNNHQKSGAKGNVNISASSRLLLQKINNKSTVKTEIKPVDELNNLNKMTKVDLSILFAGKSMETQISNEANETSPKGTTNEIAKVGTAGSRLLQQLKSKSAKESGEQSIRVISVTELVN